jgi:hypothetical protein
MSATADQIIEWLERMHTLHFAVEALYAVDGYEVSITCDGNPLWTFRAETLKQAYAAAMTAVPNPPLRQ